MKTRTTAVLLGALALAVSSHAAVYWSGLKQCYFQNDNSTWEMNKWNPSPMVMDLSGVPAENVDYTLGVFAGELSHNLGSDVSAVLPRTAENPVSGKTWGWNPMYSGFIYDGWMWMDAGVTYVFARSGFVNVEIIYIDGSKVAQDWTRSTANVTPTYTGWHPLRVLLYTHDWQAGHKLDDFASVYWNTNGIAMPASSPINEDWTGWHWLFDDGSESATRLRCELDRGGLVSSVTVTPSETGYRFVIEAATGSAVTAKVMLNATAADPEDPSEWPVASQEVQIAAGQSAAVEVPWNSDAIPYYTVTATGEETSFNVGYRAVYEIMPATSCVSAGVVTWTGAAGDGNWENKNNWDLGRVPMVDDTACFTSAGLSENSVVTIGANESVAKLVISTPFSFEIVGAGMTLATAFLERTADAAGIHTISADYEFLPGETVTNRLSAAGEGGIYFAGDLKAGNAVVIAKDGPATVTLSYSEPSIKSSKNTWTISEGMVETTGGSKRFYGTAYIGGGEETAEFRVGDNNGANGRVNFYVLTNGFLNITNKCDSWEWLGEIYLYQGGVVETAGELKAGNGFHFFGGEIRSAEGKSGRIQGDNNVALRVNQNFDPCAVSKLSLEYRINGNNSYYGRFYVWRGSAPIDLLITGNLAGGSVNNNVHVKENDGIVLSTGTNTTKGVGWQIRGGTWLADGGSTFGENEVAVLGGATLGGTGWLGGYDGAGLVVSGKVAVVENEEVVTPAVRGRVRPGSVNIDEESESCGGHVYGTLTVGGNEVANNAVFGDASSLEVGFGGNRVFDSMVVKGTASISDTDTLLKVICEAPEGMKVRGGQYTVLKAEGGLTGTFKDVEFVGFRREPTVSYTADAVVVTMPANGFHIILR